MQLLFIFFVCSLHHQTHWLLLKAWISCLTASHCSFSTIHCHFIYYSHHGQVIVFYLLYSLVYLKWIRFCLPSAVEACYVPKLYVCLTWNARRCLYELSVEVRDDCIAFFSWLHSKIIKKTKQKHTQIINSSAGNCNNKDERVLSNTCFLSLWVAQYRRLHATSVYTLQVNLL